MRPVVAHTPCCLGGWSVVLRWVLLSVKAANCASVTVWRLVPNPATLAAVATSLVWSEACVEVWGVFGMLFRFAEQ